MANSNKLADVAVIVSKVMQFRLYPTPEQQVMIWKTFGCRRWYWNQALAVIIQANIIFQKAYNAGTLDCSKIDQDYIKNLIATAAKIVKEKDESEKNKFDLSDLNIHWFKFWCPSVASFKADNPFLKEVDSQALNSVRKDLQQLCYAQFPKGKLPEFCAKNKQKRSYTAQCCYGNIRIESKGPTDNFIRLPKVGLVKIILHRPIPDGWVLKHITLTEKASGKFYISICFDAKQAEVKPLTEFKQVEAFDYSLPNLAVSASGLNDVFSDDIHWFRKMEEKLAFEQHKLSRMEYGSKNYWEQRHRVGAINEKIANRRKDFLHKLSHKVAQEFDAVGVEDIDLQAMAKSLNFGKSVTDNGFGIFRNLLAYKLKDLGKILVKVGRMFASSQTCSVCGTVNPEVKDLDVREWTCPKCGTHHDRDKNAAENIKQEAIRMLNLWLSGDKSVTVTTRGELRLASAVKGKKRKKKDSTPATEQLKQGAEPDPFKSLPLG